MVFVINLYVKVCIIFECNFIFRFHTLGEVIILEPYNDVYCAYCPCGEDLTFLKV